MNTQSLTLKKEAPQAPESENSYNIRFLFNDNASQEVIDAFLESLAGIQLEIPSTFEGTPAFQIMETDQESE